MHRSVRKGLDDLIGVKSSVAATQAAEHISGCQDCARDIESMRMQAQMLKKLRPPAELDPAPGFYARVLQRIEARAKRSIWWVFVYSPAGKRLAYTSLVVTLALGSYVIAAESKDGHLTSPAIVAENTENGHYDAPVMGTTDQQRAAVLENFVSHQ